MAWLTHRNHITWQSENAGLLNRPGVCPLRVSGQTGTSRLAVDDQHLFSDHLNSVNPVTTDGDKAHGERHFTITTHPTARSCAEP